MNPQTLDRQRIEALLAAILEPIKDNYQAGPMSPDRVYEALNALAAAAALVIRGAESSRPGAWDKVPEEFFRQALDQQLLDAD